MWCKIAAYALLFAGIYVAFAVARVDLLAAILAAFVLGPIASFGLYRHYVLAEREKLDTEKWLQRLDQEGIDPAEDIRRKLENGRPRGA